MNKYQLPADSELRNKDFVFGVATSAYQIEGATEEGGRTASIWDTFSREPGNIHNDDNGDIACDHYHLWKQDIEMIHGLGVDAYRLSISWPRILPQDGQVNPQGLKFYQQIIEECTSLGLKVYVTLYHWDLPQYLEDKGGWLNRETAYKFAEYADVVSRYFGDKIDVYTTLNEPYVSAFLGYRWGEHAPGIKGDKEGYIAAHHLLLGHGLAMPVLRKNAPGSQHGIVFNATPYYPLRDKDLNAANLCDAENYHWFIDPVLKGEYPVEIARRYYLDMEMVHRGDMEIIAAAVDYIGINYYTRSVVRYTENGDIEVVKQTDKEHTFIGWEIYPRGLTDLLVRLKQRYSNLPDLYITENGAAGDDHCVSGEVNDEQRVRYFQGHLEAVDASMRSGVPVKGYFAWSLMDNFEWAFGYRQRFGMVHVDYKTQKRTLKQSAIAYRNMLSERAEGNK